MAPAIPRLSRCAGGQKAPVSRSAGARELHLREHPDQETQGLLRRRDKRGGRGGTGQGQDLEVALRSRALLDTSFHPYYLATVAKGLWKE